MTLFSSTKKPADEWRTWLCHNPTKSALRTLVLIGLSRVCSIANIERHFSYVHSLLGTQRTGLAPAMVHNLSLIHCYGTRFDEEEESVGMSCDKQRG